MISLIVTTQGNRMDLLVRLFDSLEEQTCSDFELILVDQSADNRAKIILANYSFSFKHIPSELVSLSKARNIGMLAASGDYLGFPDDDCWYSIDVIEKILYSFSVYKKDIICCGAYDPEKERYLTSRPAKKDIVSINVCNAMRYPISIGIFTKRSFDVKFDETLGVGAKWGGGEESDYLLELMSQGWKAIYIKNILIYHPYNNPGNSAQYEKSYKYAQGYGALIKKSIHRKQYLILWDCIITMVRSCGGYIVYALKGDSRKLIYSNRIKGTINGLWRA